MHFNFVFNGPYSHFGFKATLKTADWIFQRCFLKAHDFNVTGILSISEMFPQST